MEIVVIMNGYFKNIKDAVSTLASGLKLTMRYFAEAVHFREAIGVENPAYFDQDKGIVTLQYPKEVLAVPDVGRYKLHNEIDDCIVCDKCAKICPVDCIEIDPILATETYGHASDGTPKKIHAAKFDIDMSKCCFCGLCTTVCPTECLTMTKEYDFSEYAVEDHIFSFAEMSMAEIAEKRQALSEMQEKKAAEKAHKSKAAGGKPKLVLKRKTGELTQSDKKTMPKPKIKAAIKPKIKPALGENPAKPKYRPRPMIPKKKKDDGNG